MSERSNRGNNHSGSFSLYRAFRTAKKLAEDRGLRQMDIRHLALAFMRMEDNGASAILRRAISDFSGLEKSLEALCAAETGPGSGPVLLSDSLRDVMDRLVGARVASTPKDHACIIQTKHVLGAIVSEVDSGTAERLREFGLTPARFESLANEVSDPE